MNPANKNEEGGDKREKVGRPFQNNSSQIQQSSKKVRWLTRAMAEEYTREDVLLTTFVEAIIYIIFVAAVTTFTMGRVSTSLFTITEALKGQFIESEFNTVNDVGIDFTKIRSAKDFWHYTESVMLDALYWEHYYDRYDPVKNITDDDRSILFENKVLGVPRIRQVKVKNDSCVIHPYFRRLFFTCFDIYSTHDADTHSFGPKNGTAWVHNTKQQTKSISYTGTISTYDGSGFYQDLHTTREGTAKIIAELKDNLWIVRGTRAVFVDFSVYNANLHFFVVCKLIFEFPPTGGIIPSHKFQTVHLLGYTNSWDYFSYSVELLVYIIGTFFIAEEIRELIYFKLRYFIQFWTYIDLIIILLAMITCIIGANYFSNIPELLENILSKPEEYGNLEELGKIKNRYNSCAACLLFFSFVKLFKYLSFNQTMGQLNNTLKRCAFDILGFSIMFLIIFLAFALLGYLLFGSQVKDFRNFGHAMFTLLRTILGDFDYQALERASRLMAPIYFLSYIFLVFFVLLNMFLAIINDTYADVKTEIAIAPEEMQMREFLKRGLIRILQKCGFNFKFFEQHEAEFHATIEQIRDALKKCGFSNKEIEMFFAKFNINPEDVGEYDVKKIMKELEGQTIGDYDQDTALVHVSDFITQSERFDKIETSIRKLSTNVDTLLRKLDSLENVRKERK